MTKKVVKQSAGKSRKILKPHLATTRVYQEEGHTCGLCACSAVYRFFKMPVRDLRIGLGVDKHPVPAFDFPFRDKIYNLVASKWPGAKGVLPMDMCEVIWEDGFDYETTTDYKEFIGVMPIYLDMGYPAILLTDLPKQKNPRSCPHWVVVSGINKDEICIVDSLNPNSRPEWKDIDKFKEKFNGAIMITDKGCSRNPGLKDYIANYMSGAKMGVLAAGKAWIF